MEQTTAFEKAKKKMGGPWQESLCVVQSEQRVRSLNAHHSLRDRILSSEKCVLVDSECLGLFLFSTNFAC